ncbi:hypothetical protein [Amaricoccus sp. W119]|uniref:hypothetical protein n=1 Tax=Amaricoccus sp. W119 TaxID=3391833 RepID=UPI0039A70133
MPHHRLLPLVPLLIAATAAAAQDQPAYLDDRSDGPALIRSYYNAIDRGEYPRAYAYFGDSPPVATYEAFAKGYADTVKTDLRLGPDLPDAAAGSVTHHVGVVLRATRKGGGSAVYAGCYRVVQPNWWNTDPLVFEPLRIRHARLAPVREAFERAVLPDCADDN